MLVAFLGLVAGLKWPVGLALAATSVVVAAADGQGFPLRHLVEGVTEGHASAVLAASIFHFGEHSIAEAKAEMAAAGIPVRLS